jgi:hypothetical protein
MLKKSLSLMSITAIAAVVYATPSFAQPVRAELARPSAVPTLSKAEVEGLGKNYAEKFFGEKSAEAVRDFNAALEGKDFTAENIENAAMQVALKHRGENDINFRRTTAVQAMVHEAFQNKAGANSITSNVSARDALNFTQSVVGPQCEFGAQIASRPAPKAEEMLQVNDFNTATSLLKAVNANVKVLRPEIEAGWYSMIASPEADVRSGAITLLKLMKSTEDAVLMANPGASSTDVMSAVEEKIVQTLSGITYVNEMGVTVTISDAEARANAKQCFI